MSTVYDSSHPPAPGFARECPAMPLPRGVLVCPPDYFEVIDVKNPHMDSHIGAIDPGAARAQWEDLTRAYRSAGVEVSQVAAISGCEDMVFTANPIFAGLSANGKRICVPSRMKHVSRQAEVPAATTWFADRGYEIVPIPDGIQFEGGGDAVWHPGRQLIWGGFGYRTDSVIYDYVAEIFATPVIRIPMQSGHFYHLDTCFCAIREDLVLINPAALAPADVAMIRTQFGTVIEADEHEAMSGLANNAAAFGGTHVVIQSGNPITTGRLREAGVEVIEVETGEFLKSGGSVYCMKHYVF